MTDTKEPMTDHEFAEQIRTILAASDNEDALAIILGLHDANDEDTDTLDDVTDDVTRD